jgi:rhomboid family GlyGly-CTERM serine protease
MTSHTSLTDFARSLNCDGRYLVGLLCCAALLLAPLAGAEALQLLWRYDRAAVAEGQWWRLFTAHVVHLDATHALLNCVGLVLLWALFARSYRLTQWLWAIALTLAAVDLGFWFVSTTLAWYVGASALLHGVFAAGCMALVRRRDPVGIAAGLLFVAKLTWEQWHGPLPFEQDHPVVTVSHAYGAVGGVLAGLVLRSRSDPLY